APPDRTLADGARDLIGRLGRQRQEQIHRLELSRDSLEEARARRAQASGVNTDEELLSLERHQQAFAAAARVAAVADEMLTTLLREVGR
ncbi:MAG: flagellar basal body rod C-terminal domain-containing protein, partial [Candidatus Eremiobacterota bacterium]